MIQYDMKNTFFDEIFAMLTSCFIIFQENF